MKKQFFAIILSVFFIGTLSNAVTVSAVQTDETSFFSIPTGETIGTYRSFHGEIFENGDNEQQNVVLGNGNFSTFDSAYDIEPNWIVNTEYDFTLSYDLAGNLEFSVLGIDTEDPNGNTLPLMYEPLNDTNQIFIANDNDAGSSISGMEITNMVFESGSDVLVLPNLVTSGPSFKGLIVSDFGDAWSLSGTFNFTSTLNQLTHQSSFKFYGAVPEPSSLTTLLGVVSFIFVLTKRRL